MGGGGAIGEWEAQYRAPDRVTLNAGPRVPPAILGAVLGVVFSNLFLKTSTFEAWPSALIGAAVGAVFSIVVWLTKLNRLELDPKGFTEITLGRAGEHIPWSDCTMFMPGEARPGGWYYVGFNRYSSGSIDAAAASVFALKSNYGLSLDQLVNLMNAFRARAFGASL